VTLLRFGNVISVKGGLLKNTLFLTGRGILPVFGDGNQIIPWISLKDVGRAVSFIISQKITGAVNMCQPRRTTATELFEKISIKLCNRKPILQLHIPARIIRLTQRHAAVALLDSVPAFPEELSRNGFVFSNELTL
jgi:NAD dependent epimerase/dehydratase family enzyme